MLSTHVVAGLHKLPELEDAPTTMQLGWKRTLGVVPPRACPHSSLQTAVPTSRTVPSGRRVGFDRFQDYQNESEIFDHTCLLPQLSRLSPAPLHASALGKGTRHPLSAPSPPSPAASLRQMRQIGENRACLSLPHQELTPTSISWRKACPLAKGGPRVAAWEAQASQ